MPAKQATLFIGYMAMWTLSDKPVPGKRPGCQFFAEKHGRYGLPDNKRPENGDNTA